MLLVASVSQSLRELVVAFSGIRAQSQRIFLREIDRQARCGNRVEILLAGSACGFEGLVQHVQNRLLTGVERLVSLARFLDADNHIVLRSTIQNIVADCLNRTVSQTCVLKPLANLVNRSRSRKAHVHQRAAAKINSVAQTTIVENRNPTNSQEN